MEPNLVAGWLGGILLLSREKFHTLSTLITIQTLQTKLRLSTVAHTMFITWIMSLIVCDNFCLTALKNKFPQIFKILWQLYSHYLKYITAELLRSKLKFLTRGPLRLPLTAPALSRDGRLGTMGVVSWLPPRPLPTTPLSTLLFSPLCSAPPCFVLSSSSEGSYTLIIRVRVWV